ncbi:MAG: rhamnogalacturonan acetylesterase [Acidobacteriaceae bacterium]|jgi:lysophospholipase L1-like esterase
MPRTLPAPLLVLALTLAANLAPAQDTPAAPQAPPTPGGAARGAPRAPRPPQPAPLWAPPPAPLTGPVTYTCGPAKPGETSLSAAAQAFDPLAGFDLHTTASISGGVCSSDKPFFFSFAVPEGNYRLTLDLGGKQASVVTVRAEARRLVLEKVAIPAGKTVAKTLDINVRVPEYIDAEGRPSAVRLKPREIGNLNWDQKLTIEFNGTNPSFHSLTIQPITDEPVVYLAGDSTMVDQDSNPWASWGQQLPRFFLPGIIIANEAESGETSASFKGELRMAKVLSIIKPGDYFFMQFNHNDQKPGAVSLDQYKALLSEFVDEVRYKGATPVIVTAQHRLTFDDTGHISNSLGDYPEAARQVAAATNTALIDLTAMSKTMFDAMGPGPDGAVHAFMHFPANTFPGQNQAYADNTHFNNYGAYELARCIVHGIRQDKLPIAKFLDPAVPDMDPTKFDPFPTFSLPDTPSLRKEDVTKIPQT